LTTTGDAAGSFDEVFRNEFPRLTGYCAGLVGDRDLGADLAQEALARTWSRWAAVREPHAYAYLVATNLAARTWKEQARKRGVESALASVRPEATWPVDTSVRDLVGRLPEKLRVPTLLRYYADLPAEEVARLLRRPAGTIRQRLFEARRLLAEMMTEDK
jgi:RNA polymerase sigma-70 factor (ECF subfamily)